MKILLYGLNFHPELTGAGKYTGEMAAWLSEHEHDVRVVTTPPYYPAWRVQSGYSAWRYRRETWRGMRLCRCPLWTPRRPSGLKRIVHLLSFAVSSFPVVLWQALWWRPDLVLMVAPSLSCAPGAKLAAALGGAGAWLHVQDFEVDAAFNLGLLKGGAVRRLVRAAESFVLRRFKHLSSISPRMLERLASKGVPEERCCLFPNWVDTSIIHPLPDASPWRAELDIPASATVVLYAGNMGEKQGLEALIEGASLLSADKDTLLVLCGDGVARERLVGLAADNERIRFLPLQPFERLNDLLNAADIHVLPQREGAADLVMPSKLSGMFASGRSVITTTRPETQLGQTVEGRGLVVPPEDPQALAQAIEQLAADPELRTRLGQAGREYACREWDIETVLQGFDDALRHRLDQIDAESE